MDRYRWSWSRLRGLMQDLPTRSVAQGDEVLSLTYHVRVTAFKAHHHVARPALCGLCGRLISCTFHLRDWGWMVAWDLSQTFLRIVREKTSVRRDIMLSTLVASSVSYSLPNSNVASSTRSTPATSPLVLPKSASDDRTTIGTLNVPNIGLSRDSLDARDSRG